MSQTFPVRRGAALIMAGLAAAIGLSLAPGAAASPSSAPAGAKAGATNCFDPVAAGAARVAKGHGADPNSKVLPEVATLRSSLLPGSVTIATDVHVITDADLTTDEQAAMDARIGRQIKVLNRSYGGLTSGSAADTAFQFTLDVADYTTNPAWATMAIQQRRGARGKGRTAGWRPRDTQPVPGQHRRRTARLGDVPTELRRDADR